MLQVFTNSVSGILVSAGDNIQFTNKGVQTGCTATANVGTETISLNKAGFYIVQFNASVAASAAATTPITVTMTEDGVSMNYARAVVESTDATDIESLSFTAIVRVKPSCCACDVGKKLTFLVEGADALIFNANVVVTKIA